MHLLLRITAPNGGVDVGQRRRAVSRPQEAGRAVREGERQRRRGFPGDEAVPIEAANISVVLTPEPLCGEKEMGYEPTGFLLTSNVSSFVSPCIVSSALI